MGAAGMTLLEDGRQVRTALSPLRRQLLAMLQEPSSASELGVRLGMPRQKVNYHLGLLERAGLIRLVETRARRGCVERIMQASAKAFVVDPQLMGEGAQPSLEGPVRLGAPDPGGGRDGQRRVPTAGRRGAG